MHYKHQLTVSILTILTFFPLFGMEYTHKNTASNTIEYIDYENGLNKGTELHFAALKNDFETVQRILNEGNVNINAQDLRGFTPLHHAVAYNHNAIAKLLLEKKAEINIKSRSGIVPLHYAASRDNMEITELLINYGAIIDTTDQLGHTPFTIAVYKACQQGSMSTVALFLSKHGADINGNPEKRNNVFTPLHAAANYRCTEVVKWLIEHGAQVNIPTPDSRTTPLQLASNYGSIELLTLLINAGAELHCSNHRGNTPLHEAAFCGNHPAIQLFLSKNSLLPTVKNNRGETPLESATKNLRELRGTTQDLETQMAIDKLESSILFLQKSTGQPLTKNSPISSRQRSGALSWKKAAIIFSTLAGAYLIHSYWWIQSKPTTYHDIYVLISDALGQANYEHAYRVSEINRYQLSKLSDSQKINLQDLIAQAENRLAETAAHNAASINPLNRLFSKKISIDLHYLIALESMILA